jgi:hypothetical protein
MSMEFGWWVKDPEQGKYQVHAVVHGGNLKWLRKQGHHTAWEPHTPSEEDWTQFMYEADKRAARRLLSPRQYADIKRFRP